MRFIKKTASVISSLIIILAIGGYVFVRNFDLNRYKSYISDIVARETGRVLSINGDAKLGISLVPTVVVNDVEFSNPDWAVSPQMAKLKKLEIKFAILPLLKQKIVVDKLVLEQPEIYLETAANGQNSWDFGSGGNASQAIKKVGNKVNAPVKAVAPAAALGLIAKDVILQDGVISYYDAKSDKTTKVLINEIQLEVPSADEAISLTADAVYDGQDIELELEANSLNSLMAEGKADFVAELKALKISAKIAGGVADVLESPRYAIEGNIHNPAGNFGAPETSLEFRADGGLTAADVNIKALTIANNLIRGTTKVDWSKTKPEITADLRSDVFNVNSFGRNSVVALKMPSFVSEAQALTMLPDEKVPYASLGMVNVSAKVKIGKLVLADDIILNDVLADAALRNGVLNVSKLDAGIGGGRVDSKMTVDANKQAMTFNLATNNLKLQDLYRALNSGKNGSMQILSGGDLDVVARLSSQGATYRKLSENLDGQVIAIMGKSSVKTGKLDWLANNIFSQLLQVLSIDVSKKTDMDVACAVVRTDIKSGKANFPQGIVFDASKLKLVGSGSVNLVNDKIDFTLAPALNKLADGNLTQALASFIRLKGTLDNPKIGLDKTAALTTVVGTVASGGVYLGSEVLLNGDGSPCYTALEGTQYALRFPKPSGVTAATKGVYQDVSKQAKDVVKGLGGAAKNLLNSFTGDLKRK